MSGAQVARVEHAQEEFLLLRWSSGITTATRSARSEAPLLRWCLDASSNLLMRPAFRSGSPRSRRSAEMLSGMDECRDGD